MDGEEKVGCFSFVSKKIVLKEKLMFLVYIAKMERIICFCAEFES